MITLCVYDEDIRMILAPTLCSLVSGTWGVTRKSYPDPVCLPDEINEKKKCGKDKKTKA